MTVLNVVSTWHVQIFWILTLNKKTTKRYKCNQCEYKLKCKNTFALHIKAKHEQFKYYCIQS